MSVNCEVHGSPMKLIPSGISKKTGKQYKAFYACPEPDCKETSPAPNEVAPEPTQSFKQSLGTPEKAWSDEEKSRQIARLTLAKTFINAGVDYDNAVKNADLLKWEKYVMGETNVSESDDN